MFQSRQLAFDLLLVSCCPLYTASYHFDKYSLAFWYKSPTVMGKGGAACSFSRREVEFE
jgi:hypothetical protein